MAMRAQVSSIGRLRGLAMFDRFGELRRAMKLGVNLFGKLTRDAADFGDVVDRSGHQALHATKAREQALAPDRTDRIHVLELRDLARARAARAHAGDGEP